jgi:hypothetical protein
LTLDDLATARFENPFKGTQTAFVQEINPKGMGSLEKVVEEMGSVTPEVVNRVARMGPEEIKAILMQAKAAGKAANEYAFAVRDKESVEPPIKAILSYIDLIKDALAKAKV